MVGIFRSSVFIRILYNNIMNTFCYFHAFKHLNRFLKPMYSQSNPCTHAWLLQKFTMLLNKTSFTSISQFLSLAFAPGNTSKYSLILIIRTTYRLNFKPCRFLITRCIVRLCLDIALTEKRYVLKLKMTEFKFSKLEKPTSVENVVNWHNNSSCASIQRY